MKAQTQLVWGILSAIALAPAAAFGQTFDLERLPSAAHTGDSFATARLEDFGEHPFTLSAVVDYTNNPLVLQLTRPGSSADSRIVSDYLALHLSGAFRITDRVIGFVGIDAPFYMEGDDDPAFTNVVRMANGGGMGDARIGFRGNLVGNPGDTFLLGLQGTVSFPVSRLDNQAAYRGEDGFTFTPQILGEFRLKSVRIAANLGTLIRREVHFSTFDVGSELRYAVSVGVPFADHFEALAELFGANDWNKFTDKSVSALEWIAGIKANPNPHFYASAGMGTGILNGVGSPDFRVVVSLGGATTKAIPPAPIVLDSDADGIADDTDRCPAQAEDLDGSLDADGCPDPDNDADGVPDVSDPCPNDAEDKDGIEDADGCAEAQGPVLDKDGDGVSDERDRCVDQAEDKDGDVDEDGCPEPDLDSDADGVPDKSDRCPTEAGVAAEGGCPVAVKIDSASGTISLDQQVQFGTGNAEILDESTPLLTELANALKAHSEIVRVRIEGHTDSHGSRETNASLSRSRAASVLTWLIAHGVAAERLDAWGCGSGNPIDTNATIEGRAKNRRVVLFIVDPPTQDAKLSAGCKPANR